MNQKEIRQIERLFVEWDDHNDKFIAGAIFKDGTQTRTDYDGVGPTVTHDTARELADAVVALAWHHGHDIDSSVISVYNDGEVYAEWIPTNGETSTCTIIS